MTPRRPIGPRSPAPGGFAAVAVACWLVAGSVPAAPPAPERVDFRRHVAPLLTKLGCNAAACHGAAEGRGDFALSLFGYDLLADHEAITTGRGRPRANYRDPPHSLFLDKPTGAVDHGGGELFPREGWEHRLLRRWVEDRAPGVPLRTRWHDVERLEVTPRVAQFAERGGRVPLRVVAHWNDGSAEDVTPFCRFQAKDERLATVDAEGVVTAAEPGSSSVLVCYDRALEPVETILPFPRGSAAAEPADTAAASDEARSAIDAAIGRRLRALRLTPAPPATDQEFLRRVSLDLTGRSPLPAERLAYFGDPAESRRATLVDRLLASEAYADYWAGWVCELVGINEGVMPSGPFRREQALASFAWVRERVAAGAPYDELVRGLVTGIDRKPGESLADHSAAMSRAVLPGGDRVVAGGDSLPFYWGRSNVRLAPQKTLSFAHAFLGLRLQCAECHKHPFDRWTKRDFDGLTAFFETVRYGTPPADAAARVAMIGALGAEPDDFGDAAFVAAVRSGKPAPWEGAYLDAKAFPVRRGVRRGPAPPPRTTLDTLGEWLGDPDHPRLAVAIVNRVWEHHFGRGVVDTPDDLCIGNPPTNRELLDALVVGFVASGHDLRRLHREIALSGAYQRSATATGPTRERRRQFAQALPRRLPAETLHDAVLQAAAGSAELDSPGTLDGERACGRNSVLRNSLPRRAALDALGQGSGLAVCQRERSSAVTLRATLALYNDSQLMALLDRPTGWVAELATSNGSAGPRAEQLPGLVTEAYRRALARDPSEQEVRWCVAACVAAPSAAEGVRDVLWALVNTREFAFNR